jgi:hypothetical protein
MNTHSDQQRASNGIPRKLQIDTRKIERHEQTSTITDSTMNFVQSDEELITIDEHQYER